jgi:hypothetical protein
VGQRCLAEAAYGDKMILSLKAGAPADGHFAEVLGGAVIVTAILEIRAAIRTAMKRL